MESFSGRTVILANGDYPASPTSLGILASARHVVCCDGAAVSFVRRTKRHPDAIVGDLDSLPPRFASKHASLVSKVEEQDDNDLAKAFRYCVSRGWRNIAILGATGKREDHTLANIAWLTEFSLECPHIAMITDTGLFTVVQAPGGNVATEKGMQISFFGFDQGQRLTAHGVKFQVQDLPLRRWFTATLNEASGKRVSLSFCGSPIVVFRELC